VIETNVRQLQAERIFPRQPITHGVGRLPIRQVFHELERRHQCQTPWGRSGLAMGWKQISKHLIGVDRSQCVTHLHEDIAMGKDCLSHTRRFFWNWWDWQSFE
jgi:hypothetical protein